MMREHNKHFVALHTVTRLLALCIFCFALTISLHLLFGWCCVWESIYFNHFVCNFFLSSPHFLIATLIFLAALFVWCFYKSKSQKWKGIAREYITRMATTNKSNAKNVKIDTKSVIVEFECIDQITNSHCHSCMIGSERTQNKVLLRAKTEQISRSNRRFFFANSP